MTTLPSSLRASVDTPAHDDDADDGSDEDPVGICSVQINSWTYGRLSYCYNANITSTFTDTKTGVTSVALSTVNSQATLKPRSGVWQEDQLITLLSGTGVYSSAIVKFSGTCSGTCTAAPLNPALAVTGVPMVPGASLLTSTTFSDAPAAGGEDSLQTSYSFNALPASGGVSFSPAQWSLPRKVRCDRTMEKNTVTGCVIADYKPVFDLPIDETYGAAAATYAWSMRYLNDHPGAADSPMTRLDDKETRLANRRTTCEEGSTIPFVRRDDLVPTDSCDEYPFAGTYQGGTNGALCAEIVPLYQAGTWNFYTYDSTRPVTLEEPCVRSHVPLKQNTDAGAKYSGFISSQHVIDGEKFYMNAHF
ncbi:NucA/NucB deoxyribonuclease domain-containing protein [Streptomyces sp. FR-108]|uniref:NucA/NucB deoxyribonuclease domain-containing protein n=1 Tax=Streptomyces sp. FR-108 TaxID=3416665 RepID=UPI003CF2D723